MQLEELAQEIKYNEIKSILEINDNTITIRKDFDSTVYIESAITSLWKIECKSSLLPCTGQTVVDEVENASSFESKIKDFIAGIKTNWSYKITDCTVITFNSSQLSLSKKDNKNTNTISLICP
jgi:hypothetical protein